MTPRRIIAIAGAILIAVAVGVGAWTFAQLQDEPLPAPQHGRTKCAFPEMDFHDLQVGLTYVEVRRSYADHPAQPLTLVNGCVAYRYDSYLFAQGAPTAFITLQFANGLLRGKWLQSHQPNRPECQGGIAAVVDVGDILYEYPLQQR